MTPVVFMTSAIAFDAMTLGFGANAIAVCSDYPGPISRVWGIAWTCMGAIGAMFAATAGSPLVLPYITLFITGSCLLLQTLSLQTIGRNLFGTAARGNS